MCRISNVSDEEAFAFLTPVRATVREIGSIPGWIWSKLVHAPDEQVVSGVPYAPSPPPPRRVLVSSLQGRRRRLLARSPGFWRDFGEIDGVGGLEPRLQTLVRFDDLLEVHSIDRGNVEKLGQLLEAALVLRVRQHLSSLNVMFLRLSIDGVMWDLTSWRLARMMAHDGDMVMTMEL